MSPLPGVVLPLLLVASGMAQAQNQAPPKPGTVDEIIRAETYVRPPDAVVDAVLAPRYLNVTPSNFNGSRTWFVNEVGDGPVTMDVFSKPFHELGGLFVDFRANRNRNLTIRNSAALQLISTSDGTRHPVVLPAGSGVSNATWNPTGTMVAFYVHTPDATHIWVTDMTGKARQLTTKPVLATLNTSFDWTLNGDAIMAVQAPEPRSAMPQPSAIPLGPKVKLAEESDKNRLRNYASLLATPYDQSLLEWHATGQVVLIDVKTKAVKLVGTPTMIQDLDPSPDGKYVRVTRMVRPFSYMVPVNNFGTIDEIWDMSGKMLAKVNEEPLNLGADTARAVGAPGAGESGQLPN